MHNIWQWIICLNGLPNRSIFKTNYTQVVFQLHLSISFQMESFIQTYPRTYACLLAGLLVHEHYLILLCWLSFQSSVLFRKSSLSSAIYSWKVVIFIPLNCCSSSTTSTNTSVCFVTIPSLLFSTKGKCGVKSKFSLLNSFWDHKMIFPAQGSHSITPGIGFQNCIYLYNTGSVKKKKEEESYLVHTFIISTQLFTIHTIMQCA